jgi:hypothetical protein
MLSMSSSLILSQPLFIICYVKLCFHYFACKLLERAMAATNLADDIIRDGLELDESSTNWTEISMKTL